MTIARRSRPQRLRPLAAFPAAASSYWFGIFPLVGGELRRWRQLADAIPEPALRRHAVEKLTEEHVTAEGAAAFAILAPRRRRAALVRAVVAFEVMYDYLDGVTEAHPTLANNRSLHRALRAAVDARAPLSEDLYRHHPHRDDGGYLVQLVLACRRGLAAAPAAARVTEALVVATERAAEAQSLNHAGRGDDHRALAAWARASVGDDQPDLRWFEFAASASSPLGIFALCAAATLERTGPAEVAATASAYFPWVAALNYLSESLVDRADDLRTGNHSYVGRYDSERELGARLGEIARRSVRELSALPCSSRHLLLLAGMVALNLTHERARDAGARDAAEAIRTAIGPAVEPFLLMLRMRRAARRLRATWRAAVRRCSRAAAGRRWRARRRRWYAGDRR
ncbi:DUF2600 family protein [Conexibacter stalactiti]|uniref:DUF2600 family protein n=1 Tax=Conexibacter stalactiti TaxID=1940611 RepID=A0ABU4HXA4_9ACTN|nr:DUF2600 family protein [Conexibacter stalactiti]MDW5597494.1 DUF2600 family protein [Conexibacter stalactiti]MEC5038136.1 DUF2600 family protein [Conexibacter stalactiti]